MAIMRHRKCIPLKIKANYSFLSNTHETNKKFLMYEICSWHIPKIESDMKIWNYLYILSPTENVRGLDGCGNEFVFSIFNLRRDSANIRFYICFLFVAFEKSFSLICDGICVRLLQITLNHISTTFCERTNIGISIDIACCLIYQKYKNKKKSIIQIKIMTFFSWWNRFYGNKDAHSYVFAILCFNWEFNMSFNSIV